LKPVNLWMKEVDSYLQIDKDKAIEFALKNGFYSSLIRYYHEIGGLAAIETSYTNTDKHIQKCDNHGG
jgi:hypothetical protein